jgi:hypothetical protein
MSHRIILPLAIVSLALLVACGNNGAPKPNKNGYTNSDLNGTYVISFSGSDVNLNTQTESFFAIAGTISADGNGNITGGTVDINDANLGGAGVFPAQALTASSYVINTDGRGTGTLATPEGSFGIDFVLTSDSHGLIMRFDNGGSGSGTLDLQGSATQGSLTSLAFTMLGAEFNSDLLFNPVGTVGALTLNGSGAITSGLEDFNDTGSSAGISDLALSGNLVLTSSTAGTATFNTSFADMTFDVWVVDSTHLKFIETDTTSGLALAGDAFPQQSTFTAGQSVFTVAGADTGIQFPFAAGGYVTTDANGNLSNGLEDYNDGGVPNTVSPFTGTCNATAPFVGDRCQLTLTAFTNGNSTSLTFAAYPSTAGVLLLENDSTGSFLQGAAYPQLATAFGAPEPYGFNLTGFNDDQQVLADGKVDQIGQFNATSSPNNLNGAVDENDVAAAQVSSSLSGTYAPDSPATGRGSITLTTPRTFLGSLGLEYYVINSSNTLLIESDLDQVTTGVFELQSAPGSSISKSQKAGASGASSIVALTRTFGKSHMAAKRRNQ